MFGLIGKDFPEHGYMSTSTGQNAAFPSEIYLIIRAPKGTPAMNVMSLSEYGPEEREILLGRGMRYVVHSVYQCGTRDTWYMEVEIVSQDWAKPTDWAPDPLGDGDAGYTSNGYAKEE